MKRSVLVALALASIPAASCAPARVEPKLATPPASIAPAIASVEGCPPIGPNDPRLRFGDVEMIALCRDVFVEPAAKADERARVGAAYAGALDDLTRAIGALEAPRPVAIYCATDACKEHFAGPPKRSWTLGPRERLPGASFTSGDRTTILVLRTDEGARGVTMHELTHVEVAHRLRKKHVPQWFHEGLAVALSGEPRCADAMPAGVDDLRRLDDNAAWAEYTNTPGTIRPTYCQARAEVAAVLGGVGPTGLATFLARVRDGESARAAYGPMTTQQEGPIPTVLVSPSPSLGDPRAPFTIALWIKPIENTGVLTDVSATSVGTGWCLPFLGFDGEHHLVAQLHVGPGPERAAFAIAIDKDTRPPGAWTHVAMTWSPSSGERLWVNGAIVAEVPAKLRDAPRSSPAYVAWGSSNVGGMSCWRGAIEASSFRGTIAAPTIVDRELSPAEISALARSSP